MCGTILKGRSSIREVENHCCRKIGDEQEIVSSTKTENSRRWLWEFFAFFFYDMVSL